MKINDLFNKTVTLPQVHRYIQAYGYHETRAVQANELTAKHFQEQHELFENHMGDGDRLRVRLFHVELRCDQQRNAYTWLAIKTAMDEERQGFPYIEHMDAYINNILSDGNSSFKDEQKHTIDLMRYYKSLLQKVKKNRVIGDFFQVNLQFWFMYYNDLIRKENDNAQESTNRQR